MEDGARSRLQVVPTIERFTERFVGRTVDHDAQRALVVMLEHVDDGPIEIGVVQRRGGNEQPPLGEHGTWDHPSIVPARPVSCRFAGEYRRVGCPCALTVWSCVYGSGRHHRSVRFHRRRAPPPCGTTSPSSTWCTRPAIRRPACALPQSCIPVWLLCIQGSCSRHSTSSARAVSTSCSSVCRTRRRWRWRRSWSGTSVASSTSRLRTA